MVKYHRPYLPIGWLCIIIRQIILMPIYVYRYSLSPVLGVNCRFAPSCSAYAIEAITQHGTWHGGRLALMRVLKCHPAGSSGYDPVP